MSLSKKDKEEIREMIAEALTTVHLGAEEKEETDPLVQLGEKWLKGGIRSETTHLIIAPEDVKIDWRSQFTWDEAMRLKENGDIPQGWRLPTRHEWVLICEEFGLDKKSGKLSADSLVENLNLSGSLGDTANGYYWSSTAYSTDCAYDLGYSSGFVSPQSINFKYYGFSVRCVRELE